MILYLFRHGETQYNQQGIIQGGGVDSDLNEEGMRQAEAFHRRYGHEPFDAVFGSPLRRTHQTLAPWLAQGHALQIEAGLREFNWGIMEGRKPDPQQRADFERMIRDWDAGQLDARIEGGETPREAWQRAEDFFASLPDRFPGGRLLICSHGRQLRILLSQLVDGDLRFMHKYPHHNTGLSVLRRQASGRWEALTVNNIQHLEPAAQGQVAWTGSHSS